MHLKDLDKNNSHPKFVKGNKKIKIETDQRPRNTTN